MGFSDVFADVKGKAGVKVFAAAAILLMVRGIAAGDTAPEVFSGGAGIEGDPYIIETVEQLQEIKNHVDKHFLLAGDVDASATAGWNRRGSYRAVAIGETGEAVEYLLPHKPVQEGSVRIYLEGSERTEGFAVDYERGAVIFEMQPGELYSLADENGKARIEADYETAYDNYEGFEPIRRFEGVFDGGGGVISGLYINRPESGYVSLFGDIRPGSRIMNVGVQEVDITGRDRVGGLVGNSLSVIESCYTTGRVYGKWRVGGLAAVNFQGEISNSYSRADVEGPGTEKGGLVGLQYQSVLENSYASGRVSGDSRVGGLFGLTNTRGGFKAVNSFWDTEASGRERSAGMSSEMRVEGKNTAGMKSLETFAGAGWDIVPAKEHSGETWKIDEGRDYPVLGWE